MNDPKYPLIPFELCGQTCHLLFNAGAYFSIQDQFGDLNSVMDPVMGKGQNGFDAICWYLEELATQGELYRRHFGYDKGDIPDAKTMRICLLPLDIPRARSAIRAAVSFGFQRKVEAPPGTVDLFQAEWEKKNGRTFSRAHYLNAAAQFLGLSVFEAMILPMGLILDMEELEIQRRGLREASSVSG